MTNEKKKKKKKWKLSFWDLKKYREKKVAYELVSTMMNDDKGNRYSYSSSSSICEHGNYRCHVFSFFLFLFYFFDCLERGQFMHQLGLPIWPTPFLVIVVFFINTLLALSLNLIHSFPILIYFLDNIFSYQKLKWIYIYKRIISIT